MNHQMPFVSVVIPNYNHASYLPERIESVLAQTYRHFEVILLDDCSTDDSAAVLARYAGHEKVSYVVLNEQNSGSTFKQWARGIALAQGEWVWIAESDDWCEPTLLQTLMEGVEPTISVAFCQSLMVQNGRIIWSLNADFLSKSYDGREFVAEYMLKNSRMYNASMCIFRKGLYFQLDASYTHYKFCGDWLFWILLAQAGNVYVSGKVLNYFRKHAADVSGSATQNGLMYTEYLQLLDDLVAHRVIDLAKRRELLKHKLNELLLNTKLAPAIVARIKPSYYQALKGDLLTYDSFRVLGKRLFAQICFDTVAHRP